MQSLQIQVNIKALNPKAFVITGADGSTTLFSHGKPVYHVDAAGKHFIDAIGWGRSKSTSGHIKAFTGEDKEQLTVKILAGEIELVRLDAPSVEIAATVNTENKA